MTERRPINALHRRILASGHSLTDAVARCTADAAGYEMSARFYWLAHDKVNAATSKQQAFNIGCQLRQIAQVTQETTRQLAA